MRKSWILATFAAACLMSGASIATAGGGGPQQVADSYDNCDECDDCDDGHHGLFGHGHLHRRRNIEGLSPGFNCGCNGSYKFPVPPLYTYHWPGMWSAQLMTDYHSPWRFPPLKPYADEAAPQTMGIDDSVLTRIRPVSATVAAPAREQSSFSRHLELMSR
jgi:hypothetical protein